jgi:glycosyltransferase involved in cell wall biosynthesis
MECLACGIPTILSQNTGHLDLIDPSHCYPLIHQKPVANNQQHRGTQGWGESDIDEIVETLEQIYLDRANAKQRGTIAAKFMQQWAWEKQISKFLYKLQEFL